MPSANSIISLTADQATEKLISGWQTGFIKNSNDLQKLLEAGADPNVVDEYGQNPLMKAANTIDDPECLKLLLHSGISISARDNSGRTALIAALAGNKKENIKTLIDLGANINIKLENYSMATPLMLACMHCDIDIVQILLDANAAVNSQDKSGYTALMIAIELNKLNIVNLLLDKGAKVDASVKNFAKTFPDFTKTTTYARLIQM